MNQRQVAATLRESVFSPGKSGPMQIIMNVGNIDYFIRRSAELCNLALQSPTPGQQIHYLEHAISLLAVAKFKIKETNENSEDLQSSQGP